MPGLDCTLATKSTGNYQSAASPSSILRRVAYPVEPFDFKLLPRELPPPLLKGNWDGFWQQPGLFEQVKDRAADDFKYIHKVGNQTGTTVARLACRIDTFPYPSSKLELCRWPSLFGNNAIHPQLWNVKDSELRLVPGAGCAKCMAEVIKTSSLHDFARERHQAQMSLNADAAKD